jgi:hypothetical protein
MTVTLTREEAQQVLDALVFATPSGYGSTEVYRDSIVLLQNRLAKETPYEVGQRLHRQGLGISDIPTDVYSDGDIAEAYRGFEDARLAQPEPEEKKYTEESCPVCGYYCLGKGGTNCIDKPKLCGIDNAPPQREWVGLTDEEMQGFGNDLTSPHKSIRDVFNAIEAKLKEKNT